MSKGFVIWITGLPASGKTTIARLLHESLEQKQIVVAHLESDPLRVILTPRPTYSKEERDWFYSVLRFFAQTLSEHGVNVLVDATANARKYRDSLRSEIPRFLEVYIRCPIEICEKRDPKGIYAAARSGTTTSVPGVHEPYEEPEHPEIVIDCNQICAQEGVQRILDYLHKEGWIC